MPTEDRRRQPPRRAAEAGGAPRAFQRGARLHPIEHFRDRALGALPDVRRAGQEERYLVVVVETRKANQKIRESKR